MSHKFLIRLPNGSVRGETYVRAGAEPDSLDAWIVVTPVSVGAYCIGEQVHMRVSTGVRIFDTYQEADAWLRSRRAFQRGRGRPSATVAIARVDMTRMVAA